ncbi:glycosyltransferase [Helicobacter sp. MIT 99-5507]|uniref:glycosyltransferase family 8 protein n=1 Tax=Helicobacter sp. MIT 99-5507 TaxID=152489 RepID=UPI000E1EE188|nr:glycosyltransferase [Helicobacter sp. MIT 99-5507]RDU58457.1 hypothetical protein CQA42_01315 [Helicobacter sp. MIT 99-5507]
MALWGGVKSESKLESSNKEKLFYKLYVLHNDITKDYQDLLQDSIKPFSDFSTLHFINTSNTFAKQWSDISHKAHYAKEMLYKILLSSNFPKYDKIIVSDVDVVFLGDVSKSFLEFDTDDDIYISGVKMNNPNDLFPLTNWKEGYKKFNDKELESIQYGVGGGYLIANLKKWREDNIESKMIDFLQNNANKLIQAEQDILNIICYPKIGKLSPAHIVGNAMWEIYGESWEKYKPNVYLYDELKDARLNPIQIHYIGDCKPWHTPSTPKSDIWYKYLAQSPFAKIHLENLENIIIKKYLKTTLPYRIKSYIKRNPTFLLQYRFYTKVLNKIKRKYL